MADKTPYQRPYKTASQLCQKLKNQGLEIPDQLFAEKALNRLSYYRLKAYFLPFKNTETRQFHPNTSFEDCYQLYHFDSELRHYLFSVIEKVEIGVRSLFDQWMTKETGNPFWYLDSSLFTSSGEQIDTISKLRGMFKASKEGFAEHFRSKYYNEYCPFYRDLPPGWVAIELMTFGNLVKLMSNVSDKQYSILKLDRFTKKQLSVEKYKSLCSWMTTIHEVRNNCGHHNRLFNRNLAAPNAIKRALNTQQVPLVKTKAKPDKREEDQMHRLYTAAAALQKLLIGLDYEEKMGPVISTLFDKYPVALRFKSSMGFPKNWQEEPLFFS